jgi:Zn-dependent protease
MNVGDVIAGIMAIAIAISVHEFGHAYSAHLLGDDTAKDYGRMSLNPLKHVDPIGAICLFLFRFGWAKPVPVDPNNFKNYRFGNFIVSIAGIICNILTAIICVIINKYVDFYAINLVSQWTTIYCIGLGAFNLLPVPPLDGWGIVSSFLPAKYYRNVANYERWGFFILMALLLTNIYQVILNPIYNVIFNIVLFFR